MSSVLVVLRSAGSKRAGISAVERFRAQLLECSAMRPCRDALAEIGKSCEHDSGALFFVEPQSYDLVVEAMRDRRLHRWMVVLEPRYECLVKEELQKLPFKQRPKIKVPKLPQAQKQPQSAAVGSLQGQPRFCWPGTLKPISEYFSVTAPSTLEFRMCILVGDYQLTGSNHGRPAYKKMTTEADVFMYYWDNRDGPTFEGWWFGNHVGGPPYLSHNASTAWRPPANKKWKIPWDSAVFATLQVAPKVVVDHAIKERMRQQNAAKTAMTEATRAIARAKEAPGEDCLQKWLNARTILITQVEALKTAADKLGEQQRSAPRECKARYVDLANQLRDLKQQLLLEMSLLRPADATRAAGTPWRSRSSSWP